MGEIDKRFLIYRRIKMYRRFLIFVLGFGLTSGFISFYIYEWNRMPDVIYVEEGTQQVINLGIPAKGELYCENVEESMYAELAVESISRNEPTRSIDIDFSKEIVLEGAEEDSYYAELKLFGILPYKTVHIETVDTYRVIPSGQTIGIYVKMAGVYVIDVGDFKDVNGDVVKPCDHVLHMGDYIIKVNGEEIIRKKDFTELIQNGGGATMTLTILREEKEMVVDITPQLALDGTYKIGAWIRDSLQGVGTMTFIEEDGDYSALGHAVRDVDTNELVLISSGALYETTIVSITPGEEGEAGAITGLIQYEKDKKVAEIDGNTLNGIYGTVTKEEWMNDTICEPMEIALKQEIELGEAYILSSVSGSCEMYEIEIVDINYNFTEKKRALTIEVTDERLLDMTGGIVQGMSGSPIIQDGKIVGAVTHVLVNDPTRGYGIFIENMLEH